MTQSTTMNQGEKTARASISDITIVREYPHPRRKVWRALVDPELVARWLMRPEGLEPVVGTRFRLVARPQPGWRGFVECEVLEAEFERRLRWSWVGNDGQAPMEVTFTLEDIPGGTRLTFTHTGFTGVGGFILSKLMLGPGWRKMFTRLVPRLLEDLDEQGGLRPDSTLAPKF
jgi:uncharacterized protein YndB with AHSA1/START domain